MSETEDEGMENYGKGGYHPVKIGDVYNDRYRVEHKLGYGQFSTVWFCFDIDTSTYVALKIIRSHSLYAHAAKAEIDVLTKIAQEDKSGECNCLRLLDSFEIRGVNGTHICMVFECLGPSLVQLIKVYNHQGVPLPIVKFIAKQKIKNHPH